MSQHLVLVPKPEVPSSEIWRVLQLNETTEYLLGALPPAWIDDSATAALRKLCGKKRELSGERTQTTATLVLRTVDQLGLPDKSDYSDVCEAARSNGLSLCSRKVPLGLRRRYWQQSPEHKLFVATRQIFCEGVLHVFVLDGGTDMPKIACVKGSEEIPGYIVFRKNDLFCFEVQTST